MERDTAITSEGTSTVGAGSLRMAFLQPYLTMRTLHSRISLLLGLCLTASVATASVVAAQAAPPASAPAAPAKEKAWSFSSRIDIGPQYDNNVFLLAPSRKNNLAAPTAANLMSGRYTEMTNAADLITTIVATFQATGQGLAGRDLTLAPSVAYEWYGLNAERSNATLGLALEQVIRNKGRVRIRGTLQPSYFTRNYLSNAVDGNGDGTIIDSERVYERGEYSERTAQVDYRHRLAKSSKTRPFGAWLTLGGGFYSRAHDAPFGARDLTGPTGTARLQFDFAHGIEFQTSVDVAMLGSRATRQVLLLDEPLFGEDLNGNGNSTDLNARTVQTIDRSRTELGLGETARFGLTRNTDLDLSIDFRWRRFLSDERYDVANNGRIDRRGQYGVEMLHRFSKAVRMYVGGQYTSQRLNRPTDLGGLGEVDDYSKLQAHLGFRIGR